MPNQAIYFRQEIYNELKKVDNMSALVNQLVMDYFNNKKPITELLNRAEILEIEHEIIEEQIRQKEQNTKDIEIIKQIKLDQEKKDSMEERESAIRILRRSRGHEPTEEEIQEALDFKRRVQLRTPISVKENL